jgi:creatinine amidohydrolase/Fe(II)-dependent formamide hydrolase-like protein/7-cyano-7-deazaguanine synthase in queuosine biosynthesis
MDQNSDIKFSIDGSYPEDDPLSVLQVFDSLEIGPVRLESRKLTMPYRLKFEGGEDSVDLVYDYDEDVFDPADTSMQNLAGMVGAQAAMNYGLFCGRIIFNGGYDEADRRFIQDAAENTAREIYVKKFLEHNLFLTGGAAKLPAVKKPKYLRAKLVFPEQGSKPDKLLWRFLSAERDRHAILSSGGKDSLLSYGLLNELGKETHPIFINDSERRPFAAKNAYIFFMENVPNTARVSVNSDRLFNRMLSHMPFIRKDYASVLSEEELIHLWRVAVLLFGALPIIRKRNIGRLIIGNEFNTTDRTSYGGITYYNGVYERSRYFDDALSRYYMRKGWNIAQFSILRPLSEIIAQKTLAQRYPELLEHQISCQDAQESDQRIYPCGKCDKCRRTVGILAAIAADPRKCGYTDEQIKSCLNDLASKKVHSEAPDSEHLNFMLKNKGLKDLSPDSAKDAKEHPVIMKLRFHPEKSPMNGIPVELRMPLYRIYLEYADGAVRQLKRKWIDIDPFTEPAIIRPYPFEMTILKKQKNQKQPGQPIKVEYLWAELTWPEAETKLKEMDVALLPVGAIEQHGPHLTLDVDAYDAEYLARRVADACSDPKPLVLPTLAYGVSYHHEEFPGTLSISNETLSRLVYEIGIGAAKNGIKKLVIINGHGGNSPALNYAAQMINRDAKIFSCVDTGETSDVDIDEIVETPNDVHAGEIETSTSLATRPHLVKMELAKRMVPEFSSRYLNFTSKRGVSWYAHTERISSSGVIGDPTRAEAEKGKKMWEIMIAHLVAFVEDLKSMTLDEIHQKRY